MATYNFEGLLNDEEVSQPLQATMEEASKHNPDSFGQAVETAEQFKVEPIDVAKNPEPYNAKKKTLSYNLDGLVKSAPGTAQYLQDFNAAAVSHDDTPMLERIESTLADLPLWSGFGFQYQMGQAFSEIITSPKIREGLGETIKIGFENQRLGANLSRIDQARRNGGFLTEDDELGRLLANNDDTGLLSPTFVNPEERVDELIAELLANEARLQEITPQGMNITEEGIRGGFNSLAQQAPALIAGLVSRRGGVTLGVMGAQVYADSYGQARAGGLEESDARTYSLIQSAIEMGTERLPVKSLEAILSSPNASQTFRNIRSFMIREGLGEQLATLGQTINDYAFNLDEQLAAAESPSEMLAIQARRQAVTAISTIIAGGSQAGAAAGVRKVNEMLMTEEQRRAMQNETEQMQLDAVQEVVEQSKTKQRSPTMFRKFLQEAVNAGQKEVYIDAVQTRLYLNTLDRQTVENDPVLKHLSDKLQNDGAPNGDLNMGLDRFASEFVGSEHYDALRPHMKLSAESDTQFRSESEQVERISHIQSLIQQAEEKGSIYVENQQIFNDVVNQLVETGVVSPKMAKYYGQIVPAYVTVKADETGVSPLELYKQMGLQIEGPYAERKAALDLGFVLDQAKQQGYLGDSFSEATEWTQAQNKQLDMSNEARMQRAQEMGFDTSRVLYHGTMRDFDEFQEGVTFFTTDPRVAEEYAGVYRNQQDEPISAVSGNATIPAYVRMMNPLQIDAGGASWTMIPVDNLPPEVRKAAGIGVFSRPYIDSTTLTKAAAEAGYDAVIMDNIIDGIGPYGDTNPTTVVATTDQTGVRSVSAAFDPDYADSPELLAQEAIARPLQGAPEEVFVPGRGNVGFGIFETAVQAAEEYARRSGIDYVLPEVYTELDVERATRIANEFDRMKHDPENPEVIAAYDAMIEETMAQFDVILETGLQIEFIRGEDPYANSPREAVIDVIENNHLYVFGTRDGFGSNDKFDPKDNPLLRETKYNIDGVQLLANDVFRIVHDYFGHIKTGVGFRARGEENAWQAHASMYSPLARRAMTTETRGQNSWVNFGPYGERNRTATAKDTIFADQKIGLLPLWVSEEGRFSAYERRQRYNAARAANDTGFEGAIDERGRVELVHYGKPNLTRTDPNQWGTGLSRNVRSERTRQLTGAPGRTYFGIESATSNGYRREAGLASTRYVTKVDGELLYDMAKDPEGLRSNDPQETETNILNAGYIGYWINSQQIGKAVAIFDELEIEQSAKVLQYNQDPNLQYNSMGLYSAVEKAFNDMQPQGWKKSNVQWTEEDQAEFNNLVSGAYRLEGTEEGQRLEALNQKRRKALGLVNGSELWAKVVKTPGIKKEELDWMGLQDFLTVDPKARFTREEVIRFVRSNGVELYETVADQTGMDFDDLRFDWSETIEDDPSNWEGRVEDFMYDYEREDYDWMDDTDEWFDRFFLENQDAYQTWVDSLSSNPAFTNEDIAFMKERMTQWVENEADTEYVLPVLDEIRSVTGWYIPEHFDYLQGAVQDHAEERAESEYMDNPYYTLSESEYGFSISGSDDTEWSLSRNGEYIDGGFSDRWDAESAAVDYLRDSGDLSDSNDETAVKWENYLENRNGYDSYREIKLKFDPPEGTFNNDVHFPDDNILAFLRVTDRSLRSGFDPTVDESALPEVYAAQLITDINDPRITSDEIPPDLYTHKFRKTFGELRVDDTNEADVTPSRYNRVAENWRNMSAETRLESWNAAEAARVKDSQQVREQATPKAEEVNTFFVDELQSDWHQDGRQKGYSTGLDAGELDQQAQVYLDEQSVIGAEIAARFERLITFNDERGPNFQFELSNETGFDFATLARWGNLDYPSNGLYDLVKKAGEYLKDEKLDALLTQYETSASKASQLTQQAEVQRYGVPDAPFKGDAWLNLALKRGLVEAIEKGYDAFSWADSVTLSRRWSWNYYELYFNQYDTKMKSLVKKLTGQNPTHLTDQGNEWDFSKINYELDGRSFDSKGEAIETAIQHGFAQSNNAGGYMPLGQRQIIKNREGQWQIVNFGDADAGYWTIPITDELRQKVQSEGFTLFQERKQSRGYYNPQNTLIRLNESADASTFLHEFAHFMLDMERRTSGKLLNDINSWYERNAAEVAAEANVDVESVIEWLRNGPRAGLTAEQYEAIDRATHEQFARGFETYIMEGKAPSVELRNVFRVFARMLRAVYDAITGGLNKPNLDDDMRKVFDRLLATDEQIAAEEARSRYEPLFTDAVMAGMTEDQYERYLEKSRKASDTAKEDVREKLLKELKRDTQRWWNREKRELVDQNIIDLTTQDPVYAAREKLLGDNLKMDRVMVREILGVEKVPPALRNMTITGKRGGTPDDVAAVLGFNSGAEMLNALVSARPVREVAEEQAEQQMIERHGDLMNDGRLEEVAAAAARNEERADVILTEIKQLTKLNNSPTIDKQTIKHLAARQISKLSLSELRPDRYRRAEIRSAQDAARAMANNDTLGAMRAKTQQVMNMYLWREAMNARDNADKIVRHMSKFRKTATRERIAKAGNGYWDQIQSILTRFEFRKSISVAQTDRNRQSIMDWFNERSEDGDNIVLSAEVMAEAYRKHWKELPIDELIGVYESVISIEHNARTSNDVRLAEETLTFETAIARGLDSMSRLPDKYTGQRLDAVGKDNVARRWIAEQTKIPFMMSWLDGGERVGTMHNLIMEPINQAHGAELKLWDTVGRKVVNLLQNRSKEQIKRHDRKLYIPEIRDEANDGNLRGHQVLAVALNVGNESNLRKLLLGEGWAKDESEVSIENPQLQAVLKYMTKEDWDLVQGIWDGINELFPMLADVHQRTSGLPLEKVEPMQVVTPFGNYEGGYYPMHYDPNRSQRAADNEQKLNEQTLSMFNAGGLVIPSVSTGSRINRTEYYGPVKLSLDVVANHLHEVIHFVTHYEAVKQVNKIIKDNRIAEAIKSKMGKAEYDLLKPWLNDVAKDGRQAQSALVLERMFGRLRTGVTLGVMGFKASTILIQGSGIFNTVAEVGVGNVRRGIMSVLASEKSMAEAYKMAFEKSRILKHRVSTMDREMRNVLESAEGRQGSFVQIQNASMAGIGLFQLYGVDTVSWYAAYIKGMKDYEGDEARSIKYADWVVENVQGSGATKDMAAILRNKNKAWQLFTMFMTFFSSLGNMIRDTTRGVRSGQYSTLQVAGKAIFLFLMPAIYEAVMRSGVPDDEEEVEELLDKVMFNAMMMPVGTQPVIRDALNTAAGFGYNASPVFSVLGDGVESAFTMTGRVIEDEEVTKSQIKNFTQMAGAMWKIPGVNQLWASGEHVYEVLEEGEDYSTRQLLFGPDRD